MKQTQKQLTIYLDADIHQALQSKAKTAETSVSELVNEAVRLVLLEDEEDMAAIAERAAEPTISHEELIEKLKANGKI